jgi:hypothetical protein
MLLAEGNRAHQGRGRVIDLFVQLEIDSDANDIAAKLRAGGPSRQAAGLRPS